MKKKNALMLMVAALIWGVAFVAQSVGMEYVGPFTFNGVRCLVGAVALLPVIWIFDRKKKLEEAKDGQEQLQRKREESGKDLLLGGLLCGFFLFLASSLQQIGIQYTTTGKAGFVTAFYIVIVPVLGIFLHKKVSGNVWIAVVIALVGLYFLCMTESFRIGKGDFYIFACAFVFSVQILMVDHFAPKVDGVKLSCLEFFVSGILSLFFMFTMETPTFAGILSAGIPILYAGVLSCGVAYTFQILGQKDSNPAIASLIMSLESTFSVLAGWLLLHETLSTREAIGCVFMFAAILLAQLPERKKGTDLKAVKFKENEI